MLRTLSSILYRSRVLAPMAAKYKAILTSLCLSPLENTCLSRIVVQTGSTFITFVVR